MKTQRREKKQRKAEKRTAPKDSLESDNNEDDEDEDDFAEEYKMMKKFKKGKITKDKLDEVFNVNDIEEES